MVVELDINRGNRYQGRNRTGLRLTKAVARSIEDPALNGRWFTYVQGIGGPTEVLVEHQTIPFHKSQPSARPALGAYRHYPGAHDVDGIQVVFYEAWDYRVTNWLNYWRRQVYNPETGHYGWPKFYRREFVTEFYPQNSETPSMRRSYAGCFPVEQQPFELSYAEVDGRLTVACLFAVNKVETFFYSPPPGTEGLPTGYNPEG